MDNKTRIFSAIFRNEGIHIRELSRLLNIGLPTIDHHLKTMEKEHLIKKVTEGRNVKLYVNYASLSVISELYDSEYGRILSLPAQVRDAIFSYLKSLDNKPVLTILFGSYAKGTYNSKSDIDLLVIFHKPERTDIESKAKAVKYKYNIEISPAYMAYSEFKGKFYDEKDTFMKELKKDKILIQGIEWWFMFESEKS